jgi:tetratricopeptide (TPR) repeat protein
VSGERDEHGPNPTGKTGYWLIAGVALLLIALGFSNAPRGEFVYDDEWQVVRNPLIQNPTLYKRALTSDVWSFRGGPSSSVSNYYRPVFTAWSIANFRVFGLDPAGWHMANIVLHAVVSLLVLLLLFELGLSPPVAALATWIFAVHPVHVESVTWIAGAPDILMAGFAMGSLVLWLRSRARRTAGAWAAILVLFLLALGSKESAIALIPLVGAIAWLKPRNPQRQAVEALKALTPFLVAGVAFFAVRAVVMQGAGIGAQNPVGLASMALTVPEVMVFYLRQTLWPLELSPAYPLRTVTPNSASFSNFILPLALLVVAAAASSWLAKRSREAAIGLWLFLLFLAPALYVRAFHPEHIVRDRYLYLPLLGLALLVLAPFDSALGRRAKQTLAAGFALAAGLAFLTFRENETWMSDVALWRAGVESDLRGAMAHMQLAESLRRDGKASEALPLAQKAVGLDPGLPRPYTVLGMVHKDLGDHGAAIAAFERAISFRRDTLIAAEHLADIHQRQREPEKAIAVFEEEIARNPASRAVCVRNIAVLLADMGRREDALRRLEEIRPELEAYPNARTVAAWFFMAELYLHKRENAKAADAYERFLRDSAGTTDPQTRNFRNLSEQMLRNLGRP